MEKMLILAGVFFVVSAFFSMLGQGGGIFYVPILLSAGYTMQTAPGISLLIIVATATSATLRFAKKNMVDWKLACVIDPPTDIMAFVGGYFSSMIPDHILRWFLIGILVIASVMMFQQKKKQQTIAKMGWWYWKRSFNDHNYAVNLPLVLIATALVGVLSGMLGITGGIIKVPIMVLVCGVPMGIAVATSSVMVVVTALCGLIGHVSTGPVEWTTGLTLATVGVAGGLIGSHFAINIDKTKLKKVFSVVMLAIAGWIAYSLLK